MLQEPVRQEFRLLLGDEVAALGDDAAPDVVRDLTERGLGLVAAAAGLGARTAERQDGHLEAKAGVEDRTVVGGVGRQGAVVGEAGAERAGLAVGAKEFGRVLGVMASGYDENAR